MDAAEKWLRRHDRKYADSKKAWTPTETDAHMRAMWDRAPRRRGAATVTATVGDGRQSLGDGNYIAPPMRLDE